MDVASTGRVAAVCDEASAARLRRISPGLELAIASRLEDVPAGIPIVVVGEPTALASDARIAHVVRGAVADDQLVALLTSIAAGRPVAPLTVAEPPADPVDARRAQLAFTLSRKLAAASDAPSTERLAIDAIVELCDVERAYC